MAKLLTPHQEQIILNRLRELEYVSRGSSRMVYDCPNDIKYMLGLNACLPYVIKLSVGSGGIAQTDAELNMFLENGRQYLAEVFYFGHFLMVCEAVDTDEWLDFAEDIHGDDNNDRLLDVVDEYLEYNFNWDGSLEGRRHEYEKAYMDAAIVIRFLAGFNGCTSDNGQLGTSTHDGRLVAYDYGFIAGKGCDTQCSGELVDNISGDEVRFNEYIDELVQVLEEMKETYMKLDEIVERAYAVEKHINNTVDLEWRMKYKQQRIDGDDLEEVNEDDDLEFGWNNSTEQTCSSCR